jgi:hypothetical protein
MDEPSDRSSEIKWCGSLPGPRELFRCDVVGKGASLRGRSLPSHMVKKATSMRPASRNPAGLRQLCSSFFPAGYSPKTAAISVSHHCVVVLPSSHRQAIPGFLRRLQAA